MGDPCCEGVQGSILGKEEVQGQWLGADCEGSWEPFKGLAWRVKGLRKT